LTHNSWKDLAFARKDSRYKKLLHARAYNNNLHENPDGFYDYWENGISRPDLLLKDLFDLINNPSSSQMKLTWYKELK
jgi:hypothetical protein